MSTHNVIRLAAHDDVAAAIEAALSAGGYVITKTDDETVYCNHGLEGEDCALADGHASPGPASGSGWRWHVTLSGKAWSAEDDPMSDDIPETDDGAVRSPATPRAVTHPAARAGETGWRPAPSSPVLPRPFLLFRTRDVTGMSGTGVVAWGCEFPDGAAALRWATAHPSTVAWPSVEDIVAVHGHQGATVIRWLDGGA